MRRRCLCIGSKCTEKFQRRAKGRDNRVIEYGQSSGACCGESPAKMVGFNNSSLQGRAQSKKLPTPVAQQVRNASSTEIHQRRCQSTKTTRQSHKMGRLHRDARKSAASDQGARAESHRECKVHVNILLLVPLVAHMPVGQTDIRC